VVGEPGAGLGSAGLPRSEPVAAVGNPPTHSDDGHSCRYAPPQGQHKISEQAQDHYEHPEDTALHQCILVENPAHLPSIPSLIVCASMDDLGAAGCFCRSRASVQRLLSFRTRFPASVHPEPLIGITPHVLLDHLGEKCGVGHNVRLVISGANQVQCGLEPQAIFA